MTTPNRRYKGLLLDFGGVITTDFFASIDDHLQRLGLPRGHFRQLVTADPAGRALYQRVERGEVSQSAFECQLAALLRVEPDGLIASMLAGLRPDQRIIQAAARARAAGILVGVITNSWGTGPIDPYASYHLNERYDAVIVSGEVGIRKPDPAVYLLAAEKLGLPTGACVLVDDVAANLPQQPSSAWPPSTTTTAPRPSENSSGSSASTSRSLPCWHRIRRAAVRTFHTSTSRPALRAAASGGRPRPAACQV